MANVARPSEAVTARADGEPGGAVPILSVTSAPVTGVPVALTVTWRKAVPEEKSSVLVSPSVRFTVLACGGNVAPSKASTVNVPGEVSRRL